MSKRGKYFLIVLGVLFVGACAETPTSFGSKIGYTGKATLPKVTAAILDAAKESHWRTKLVRPGLIEGYKEWGGGGRHKIWIEVEYDAKKYRFVRKKTEGLKDTGRTIHKNYNYHLNLFDKAIKARTWKY